jgi:hypothetical protein
MLGSARQLGSLRSGLPISQTTDGYGLLRLYNIKRETRGFDPPRITLAEAGIDKNLAKQAHKFAALPDGNFEVLAARRAERWSRLWWEAKLSSRRRRTGLVVSTYQRFS